MDAKLKAKAMTDDQLDGVAGGTYDQSWDVALKLKQAGIEGTINGIGGVNFDGMRKAISDLGFESKDHGGFIIGKANTYVEKSTGKEFTQKEFVDFLKQKFPVLQEQN
ncbi:MAG: hypothetical protein IJ849_03825 [Selenomonadaceae bacterium]|nr:hypothetical protein [Selenomonadaceae bacterium]